MKRKIMTIRKLNLLLPALLITACSFDNPVSLQNQNLDINLSKEEIRQMDKEYSAFSLKSLSASYVKRKLQTWLTTGNEAALVKELLYAQAKGETDVPITAAVDEDMCESINSKAAVNNTKTAIPSFGIFMNSICPPLAPVEGRILFDNFSQKFSTMDSNGKHKVTLADQNGSTNFNSVRFSHDGSKIYTTTNDNFFKMDPDGTNIASLFEFSAHTYNNAGEGTSHYIKYYQSEVKGLLPDESRLAFEAATFDPPINSEEEFSPYGDATTDIFIMNAGETNAVNITNTTNRYEELIGWAANNSKIIFRTYNENIAGDGCVENDQGECIPIQPDYVDNLYSIKPDGTEMINLTNGMHNREIRDTTISPDGSKIYFTVNGPGINIPYIMNADGTDRINLKDNFPVAISFINEVRFSADSNKLIFGINVAGGQPDIFTINTDGTGSVRITDTPDAYDSSPNFLPDGRIIYLQTTYEVEPFPYDIFIADADGTNKVNITASIDLFPEGFNLSPGKNRLVFSARLNENSRSDIYRINLDGSGLTNLTNTGTTYENPLDWK
jgi:Tol biopolymer transport system component